MSIINIYLYEIGRYLNDSHILLIASKCKESINSRNNNMFRIRKLIELRNLDKIIHTKLQNLIFDTRYDIYHFSYHITVSATDMLDNKNNSDIKIREKLKKKYEIYDAKVRNMKYVNEIKTVTPDNYNELFRLMPNAKKITMLFKENESEKILMLKRLPKTVKSLIIKGSINKIERSIPNNIIELEVDGYFDFTKLPKKIQKLKINEYDLSKIQIKDMQIEKLSNSLTEIDIATDDWNDYSINKWPKNLKKIKIRKSYGSLCLSNLPEGLKKLSGYVIKYIDAFPKNLKILDFGYHCKYDKEIKDLPEGLHTLYLGYNQRNIISLPQTIKKLIICANYQEVIKDPKIIFTVRIYL